MSIPIIAFSAYSGTGKTTIIVQLIKRFKASGLRVAVIKHDAHQFEIDQEGKDSWRFSHAGSDITIISSKEKTAIVEQRELCFKDVLSAIHDVDIILVEGYKSERLAKIGISRRAAGKGFPESCEDYVAVITDEDIGANIPRFDLDDIDGIAEFIIQNMRRFSQYNIDDKQYS